MKHHIAVKFLAVMLCAAFLFTAVASGIGALCMTEANLYEQTPEELYTESVNELASIFANQIALNYASEVLGGCPSSLTRHYVSFTPGYYGYTLMDAEGNVLKSREADADTPGQRFHFNITGEYKKLISVTPESELYTMEPTEAPQINVYDDEYVVYDWIPPEGAEVQRIHVTYYGIGDESCGVDGVLGFLIHQEDGSVAFVGEDDHFFLSDTGPVSYICFFGMDGELLYQATAKSGGVVGEITQDENGSVHFQSWLSHFDTSAHAAAATTELVQDSSVIEMPTEAPTEAVTEPETQDIPTAITDNLERLGVQVANITIFDEYNYTGGIEKDRAFGYLYRNTDGTVTFQSYAAMDIPAHPEPIQHIAFLNPEGQLLYDVQSPDGVGKFTQDNNGCLIFTTTVTQNDVAAAEPDTAAEVPTEVPTETPTEAPTEVPTEAPTEADSSSKTANIIAEVTEPTTTAEETVPEQDIETAVYYDDEYGEYVHARYVYEPLPEGYTVELILLHGAYEMDHVYDLICQVWTYRNELLYVLGISLFFFAVFAVYLCCAAGRKPGRDEVRANGFNCLPLDVYLVLGTCAVGALVVVGAEGGYYLLRHSSELLAPFVIIMGYAAALIIVGFCFACAAQLKTPGGYWWRNTLFVRTMSGFAKLMIGLERFLRTRFFPWLGKALKALWKFSKRFLVGLYRYTEKFLSWLVQFTARCVKFIWKYGGVFLVAAFKGLEKGLIKIGRFLGKIAQRTHAWLHAFLSLLPVTWQWLLTGLLLLFILFLAILTRSEGFMVLGLLAGIALVIYGSHCFGILWESTRKMSKGDLELKVDDKLMVGCFKDFAGDLNALADVAVVAAEKQLKSDRMKTELITNVSHDIKTPLTSIINYVDLLQKPHTDEEQEVYLEVISRQSLQMKKLLEDLIEMSKASTGNMAVYLTKLNAGEAVSQALGEFADKLEKAQLTVVVQQPEDPVYMQADGRLVWRVLSNILSNAVKYAMPGTRVYVDLVALDGKVLISVKNISREPLNVSADELMERFVRGDASRNTEGSGLGLNIAQSLMEIQKGSLQLLVDGDLFKVTLALPGSEE